MTIKKRLAEKQKLKQTVKQARQRTQTSGRDGHRLEIWLSKDGTSSEDMPTEQGDGEDSLMKLSAVELNKRFVLSFLHVHGKLFTKIG